MVKEIAGYIVAPMWHEVMQYALGKYPNEVFPEPPPISDSAPAALRGVYTDGTSMHDILYWVNKDNPLSGGSSVGDAQYAYWEFPVGNWLAGGALSTPNSQTATTTGPTIGINGEDIGGQ